MLEYSSLVGKKGGKESIAGVKGGRRHGAGQHLRHFEVGAELHTPLPGVAARSFLPHNYNTVSPLN